jgi:hypothetical protein
VAINNRCKPEIIRDASLTITRRLLRQVKRVSIGARSRRNRANLAPPLPFA